MSGDTPTTKRSLFQLIGDIPRLLRELISNEIESLKQEIVEKIKHAGIGIGLFVGAAVFAFFAVGVLLAAAVLGLAVVLPAWAAALIVAGVLLIITAALVLVGMKQVKQGTPPTPTKTISSIKEDVKVFTGTAGKADNI